VAAATPADHAVTVTYLPSKAIDDGAQPVDQPRRSSSPQRLPFIGHQPTRQLRHHHRRSRLHRHPALSPMPRPTWWT